MKNKNVVIGVVGVALLAGGIYLGKSMGNSPASNPVADPTAAAAPKVNAAGTSADDNKPAAGAKASSNSRESAWANLTAKYGDGKTKLSKKITDDMAGMLDDAMELADMGAELGGGTSAKDMATKQAVDALSSRLGLTDEQKAKVTDLVAVRMGERMDAVKELTSAMRDDPSGMMQTMLAGDAFSRKEITEEEYNAASADTLAVLKNVSGFALAGPGGGSQISDPLLAQQLQSVLNAEQQAQLAEMMQKAAEKSAAGGRGEMPFQNGNLPVMELEKLDQTMMSAQKLTTGLKAMMEGFKGLKAAVPEQPAGQ